METIRQILIDENHKLFDKKGMFSKEFPSDFRQIRYFTLLVVQKAPIEIREVNLLEQQIAEILMNAIKHGNRNDLNKKVKVWYNFTSDEAHIIVEDEGDGFQELEQWNEFHKKRTECFMQGDFEEMEKYVSFRTPKSEEMDGGNAMFAAIDFWDGGIVYNKKKNAVALLKTYPKKRYGVSVPDSK